MEMKTMLVAAVLMVGCGGTSGVSISTEPTSEETEKAFAVTWDPYMSQSTRPNIHWIPKGDCVTEFDGYKVKATNGNCLGTYVDSTNAAALRWEGAISANLDWCSAVVQLSNRIRTGSFDSSDAPSRVSGCQSQIVAAGL